MFVEVSNGKRLSKGNKSKYNLQNTAMVMETAILLIQQGVATPEEIAILPMFPASRETYICAVYMAAQQHRDLGLTAIRINTSDGFQGAGSPLVLLDLAATEAIRFLSQGNRLNVGISHAKLGLWVFGKMAVIRMGSYGAANGLKAVIDAMKAKDCVTKQLTVEELPRYVKGPTQAKFRRTVKKYAHLYGGYHEAQEQASDAEDALNQDDDSSYLYDGDRRKVRAE